MGLGADVNEPNNAWQMTSLCGKSQHTVCAMGGAVQAMASWFTPHNGELVYFTPAR